MAFKCEGYQVELVDDGEEALDIITERHREFSAVFLDLLLPRKNGLSVLKEIRTVSRDLPVFVTSAAASTPDVVHAMKAGATDFIPKPVSHQDLRKYMLHLAVAPPPIPSFDDEERGARQTFLGNSARMREIQSMIRRISASEAPVLIQGETGAGKEVLAREIHANSPRANRPFLKLNCAALPSELVESELFGYERGAFTGAFQRKAGMFELADRGTILLDEIGDMDYKLQAKLLQVLQDHEFQRLGGKEVVRVDVRVMAATHRNLELAIQNETFREDLFYRLNVITVKLPPLRERKEDVIPLAHSFLQRHAGSAAPPQLTIAAQQAMLAYDWPGNVRELENIIRRFIILRDPAELTHELALRAAGRQPKPAVMAAGAAAAGPIVSLPANAPSVLHEVARAKEEAEIEAILQALNATHWNRKRAARMLNIDYKALLYKMKKLSIGEDTA
jgi:two-component system response regulator AtoC